MNPEARFILKELESVVTAQPADYPLRRVNRDESRLYDTTAAVDLSAPIHTRKAELQRSNLVGVASQSRENDPLGTAYNVRTDVVLSVRIEGLHYTEHGNIDPDATDGVAFDALCEDIRGALYDVREYPSDPDFPDAKLDLRIENEDYQSSDYKDYYRREFDVVFRGRETL